MHEANDFLRNLALVLCAAAVTTVLFQRLRQPVVLGYLLAGMIIGPHIPIPLVADQAIVHALSELGVILLMFSLGLEFSLQKLVRVAPTAGVVAIIQSSLMVWLGFLTAQLFGWSVRESIYTGALIAISSTTIIVKVFAEQGITGKRADLVFGVLIVEDLIAILLMALLTTISAGDTVSFAGVAATAGKLAAFLGGLLVVGLLSVPRLVRALRRLNRPETTLVASIGVCFAVALLADAFGYSVALGAFLAGSLIAESGQGDEIEHLIHPVRDMFAAIFFVSVGMLIDPLLIAAHWSAVLVLTLVVVVGKIVGVALGTFLTGQGIRTSIQSGMSLAQIGEFSFIIAGLGMTTHATGDFLYPVAVAVSAITTLVTPWLIRASDPFAQYVDRHLPTPLQTFATLYGSWLERLRSVASADRDRTRLRLLVRALLVDAGLLVAIVMGAAWQGQLLITVLVSQGLSEVAGRLVMLAAVSALCVPFAVGIIRCAREMGVVLGDMALPNTQEGRIDLADAPRRVLVVTLQLATLLLVGAPLVALTQPFLPAFYGAALLLVALMLFAVSFWRSAQNLQGHARAGAQIIVEALLQQARGGERAETDTHALDRIHELLPGLGAPVAVRLARDNHAVGKTLAELNLRGLTTATALAIVREDGAVVVPNGKETLHENDILAVAGTHDAIAAAENLLRHGSRL